MYSSTLCFAKATWHDSRLTQYKNEKEKRDFRNWMTNNQSTSTIFWTINLWPTSSTGLFLYSEIYSNPTSLSYSKFQEQYIFKYFVFSAEDAAGLHEYFSFGHELSTSQHLSNVRESSGSQPFLIKIFKRMTNYVHPNFHSIRSPPWHVTSFLFWRSNKKRSILS